MYRHLSEPRKQYGSPKKNDPFIWVVLFLILLLVVKNLLQ